MSALRSFPYVLAASAVAYACSSSTSHRAVVADDGGVDGGVVGSASGGRSGTGGTVGTSGAGGRGNGGAAMATGGAAGGTRDAGAPVTDAHATPDAHTDTPDASVDPTPDGGPPLGEFCVFADSNMEDYVRNALSNQNNIDGGVPSGPIPVALAARVKSLDLFCDCSDVLDLTGSECLVGLESLELAGDYDNLDALGSLPRLTNVRFQYTNTLPDELASFRYLQKLDLSNDSITDLSAIAGLTSITEIDLSNNPISDLTPLSGLVNLRKLRLYSAPVVDLTPLAGLRKLEDLDFYFGQVSDLTPLAGITSLTRLIAGHNQFTDISPLSGLQNLTELDVTSTLAITNFAPLVANAGLAAGDNLYASPKLADCASFKADAKTLADRGVTLLGFPVCP